jgi:V/A-type H+-transporting ATPase subunit D
MGVDSTFDQTRHAMAEAALLLTRLGEVEMALARLMAEQRKAQKRVNALKYNIIPRYRNSISYIRSALEEEERNTLFQIKILRSTPRS